MTGHGVGALLLAAVAGYWVLERAETHKNTALRPVGRALGWFIILASVSVILFSGACAGSSGKSWCPFMSRASSGTATPPAK